MDNEKRIEELKKIIDFKNVPKHVAIIMDGNGRWAVEKGLPRREGHRQGVETVRETVKNCSNLGVKILTLFAFSTENWRRPAWEVNYLMSLPEKYFEKELPELMRNNVKVQLVGDKSGLPGKVQKAVSNGVEKTINNTGMILNFALNYGARSEILMAVNNLISEKLNGKIKGEINEKVFSSYLYTAGMPDPDLLIRTSGELRISNFLLWQLAYSELWFTEILWPDFSLLHLLEAIDSYQQRKRRYGSL
ncbi:MAG: isoprenyl transferase [Bacillota bacterium]|nr:isoprenyl transferase [Bacillota bacterium]